VPPAAGFEGAGDAACAGAEDVPPDVVGSGDALGVAAVGIRPGEAAADGSAAGVTVGCRCPGCGAVRGLPERRDDILADRLGAGT
jgi:hypothetical protein